MTADKQKELNRSFDEDSKGVRRIKQNESSIT